MREDLVLLETRRIKCSVSEMTKLEIVGLFLSFLNPAVFPVEFFIFTLSFARLKVGMELVLFLSLSLSSGLYQCGIFLYGMSIGAQVNV